MVPAISGRHAMLSAAVDIFSQPLDTSLEGTSHSPLVAALQRLQNSKEDEEDFQESTHLPVSFVETVSQVDEDAGTDASAAERQEGVIMFPKLLELLTKSVSDFEKATSDAAAAANVPDMVHLCKDVRAQLRELGCDVGPVRKSAAAAAVGLDAGVTAVAIGALQLDTEDKQSAFEEGSASPTALSTPSGCSDSSRTCCNGSGCTANN